MGGEVDASVVDDDFFSTRRDLELKAPTTPPTLQRSPRLSEWKIPYSLLVLSMV